MFGWSTNIFEHDSQAKECVKTIYGRHSTPQYKEQAGVCKDEISQDGFQ